MTVRRASSDGWRAIVALLVALPFAAPLAVVAWGSMSGGARSVVGSSGGGPSASTSAYRELASLLPITDYLWNSVLVALVAVPLTILVASAVGWAIRLSGFRARWAMVAGVVGVMLVPPSGLWSTRFQVFRWVGLSDGPAPLAAPALMGTSAFFVLVYVWAFHAVDDDVVAAAVVDGAGPVSSWWRVALPQARGATLAVAALSLAQHWGNLMGAVLHLRDPASFTLPLGLRLLQQLAPTQWQLLLAGVVVTSAVPLMAFLAAQGHFLTDDALDGGR